MNSLASIIIVNFNYGRFLRAAIDSALAQTYPHVEVVVVDDGSTDDSREIIRCFGKRVVPIFKANGGQASAVNAGFVAATGDVFILLDADDVLLPNALSEAMPCFKDPRVVHVHWPMWEIDGAGNKTGAMVPHDPLVEGELRSAVIESGPDVFHSPPCSGNAWSSAFASKVMPMPQDTCFRRHAEMYLVTLSPLYGALKARASPQSCYRIHGTNDYATAARQEQDQRNRLLYLERCKVLQHFLGESYDRANLHRWLRSSWLWTIHGVRRKLDRMLPQNAPFALLDEEHIRCELLDRWDARPFPERNGEYWGRPESATQACDELERQRRQGAQYLVVAWPAFWWLDHYIGFGQYIRANYRCLLESNRLMIFDLRHPAKTAGVPCGFLSSPLKFPSRL